MPGRRFVLISTLVICGLTGCGGGQRLVDVQIERDGVPLLQGQFGIGDEESAAAAWNHLSEARYKAVGPFDHPNDPRQATIRGNIRIILRHAGNILASATVSELKVTLAPGTDIYWLLPQDEVERTATLRK